MSAPWLESYRDAADRQDRAGMAGRPSAVTPLINRIVLDALGAGPGDVVVDFGCGDGSLLAAMAGCERRIGIVPSREEVEALQAFHAGTGIEFIEALAPALPLPEAMASRIVSNGVFLLLPSDDVVRALLREMHRVLHADGRAYIGEVPTPISPLRRLLRRPFEILQTHGPGELLRRLVRHAAGRATQDSAGKAPAVMATPGYWTATPAHFRALAEACGWQVERVTRHEVRDGGRWVEYPRNRYNYTLRRAAGPG
jgi:SAM-dependent methyltransferase